MTSKVYRNDLDFLKGIAIIAVVFYHASLVQSGYLGVDLFFVINGFLIIPSLCRNIANSKRMEYYLPFMKKRLMRLWPLIIIASIVCFLVGYFVGMLPDDFENLDEGIFASNLMSNNVLSAITIRDYWGVRTQYQPLMHLWYVGILFEFYVVTPLFLYAGKFAAKKMNWGLERTFIVTLLIPSVISLYFYLSPSISEATRFYHLHARYYELGLSGIAALICSKKSKLLPSISKKFVYYVGFLLLFFFIFISLFDADYLGKGTKVVPVGAYQNIDVFFLFINRKYLLLLVVALSILIVNSEGNRWLGKLCSDKSPICWLGKMSFSIYIWHQVLLAFERYFYSNEVTVTYVFLFLLATLVISIITYNWVEQKVKVTNKNLIISAIASFCICIVSYYYYNNAGVTRDVPELGVTMKEATKKMHSKYLKRTYKLYDKGYFDNGKYNVCTIGNSFMSDFVNILMESNYADSINLKMARYYHKVDAELIRQSDYVFIFDDPDSIPAFVRENIDSSRIYGIGTKTFGDSNGVVYRQRNKPNYFNLTIQPHKEYVELNELWQKKWGDHYINLHEMTLMDNGEVRLFTPNHMLMSQDCKHLTQPGAKFFAERIDFSKMINSKRTR